MNAATILPPVIYTLEQAENRVLHAMRHFPKNDRDHEGQRNYLAGIIDCLFWEKKINEKIRGILYSIYFEGLNREFVIEQLQ